LPHSIGGGIWLTNIKDIVVIQVLEDCCTRDVAVQDCSRHALGHIRDIDGYRLVFDVPSWLIGDRQRIEHAFINVLIYFINEKSDGILLMDDQYQCYQFDKQLKIGAVVKTIPNETIPTQFMTFSVVETDAQLLFAANDQILDMKTFIPLSLKVPGSILSMMYYMNYLFILYVSNYNQFSVLQYDPDLDQILTTVEGGYLSGPPVYSCICKNNILVSASPNQIIPLTQFNLPLLNDPSDASMNNPYPLFDLPPSDARYIEDKLPLPIDALKNKVDTLELDTRPAQKQLAFSYLWTFFCLVVILVLIAMVFFQDPFILRIGVAILVVSILFMCSQYI
jgi:hypothetical protein